MSDIFGKIAEHWTLLVPLLLGAVALWLLLPRWGAQRALVGGVVGLAALIATGFLLVHPSGEWVSDLMFFLFAGSAIGCGVMVVTSKNPVYAALWFALVTLSTCGLFLLQSAPFLAAATVIVYAGAIIVTFLFVIMLARQAGSRGYDQRASQPLMATFAAFLLLGGLLYTLQDWRGPAERDGRRTANVSRRFLPVPEAVQVNTLSASSPERIGEMRGLGRSLFGDYLFAVELSGTLLLVAAIGAIAIAPRRSQETL